MKNKFLAPFVLTGLTLALIGCGAEKTKVNEDPYKGVTVYSNGCDADSTDKCLGFYVDYPIEGLNFDCSTNTTENFETQIEGGLASGGCLIGDKAKFYIQGSESSRRITLGDVDLSKIRPLKVAGQPAAIGLIDIASAMTGKAPTSMTMSDDTFKVMVGLTRVFQALGEQQEANQIGDVQPIELSANLKNNIKLISANVGVADFLDGSYVEKLKPWINVSSVSESVASTVAEKLIKQSLVNVYSTNFYVISPLEEYMQGFTGKSTSNPNKESIANMYLVTDRTGYTTGYAMQWVGIPKQIVDSEGKESTITKSLLKYLLISQALPQKLDVGAQQGWINPLTRKIESPLALKSNPNASDKLEIYQGTLLNNTNIASSEYMYKSATGLTTASTDPTVYGRWRQTLNGEQLTGNIDVFKSNSANYLDKNVFLTKNTVKTGEKYYFPLYANIKFNFDNSEIPAETLGIVIDENGDIRTNLGVDGSLSSNTCNDVDPITYLDKGTNVQQYRIGTTGTAYVSGSAEKSITLRMILANPIFKNLDGAVLGLNESLIIQPISGSSSEEEILNGTRYSGGVRLNLQRLINDQNVASGVNITSWGESGAVTAGWGNISAAYQAIYNSATGNTATTEQQNLAKRTSGTLSVNLTSCYAIKTK
ncbi:putative pilus system protein FilF [Acinetobacter wuhouensis]|uniref:Protein FilF n=1 Tax=Acinetobacter wuhouensis TaxID=1879050 RepID=A0A3G2T5J2_9GAMM|nr:hypothetical protein [Acinetobacter wuhouensis]AYO55341.1 hypothetical protein CDG68_17550 [Acinetobacter wuhouensis]